MARLTQEIIRVGLRAAIEIRNGKLPTKVELGAAPILTQWAMADYEAELPRLIGFVQDHPLIGSGWCTTSVVLAMAPDASWARTVSRLYRLSEPLVVPK